MTRLQQIKSLEHQYLVAKCDHKPRTKIWERLRDKRTNDLKAYLRALRRPKEDARQGVLV